MKLKIKQLYHLQENTLHAVSELSQHYVNKYLLDAEWNVIVLNLREFKRTYWKLPC